MARTDTLPHFLTDVADAIREKGGISETIQASSFDTAISDLPSGGGGDLSEYFNLEPNDIPPILPYANHYNIFSNICIKVPEDLNLGDNFTNYSYFFGYYQGKTGPIYDFSKATDIAGLFYYCQNLETVPQYDFSEALSVAYMFSECVNLKNVPAYSMPKVASGFRMLYNCRSLTTESLNNILATCASMTSFTDTKTLYYLFGNRSMASYYPASTIQGLSNYTAFTNAGWSIGWN